MNKASITAAFAQLLRDLPGEAPTGAQLDRWAERLTSAWCDELLGGELIDLDEALGSPLELTTKRQEIAMSGIRFSLVCPHHHAAIGEASVSYQPRHHVAGPSGLVRHRRSDAPSHPPRRGCRDHQTPSKVLQPHGLEVTLSSEQTCVSCRRCGAKGPPLSPPSGVALGLD